MADRYQPVACIRSARKVSQRFTRASTGKQYMIPGDNGKVISNKDMQSGGGISVQVNVINQSTGATVQSANGYMQDGSAVVDLLITDMERGGPVSLSDAADIWTKPQSARCLLNPTRFGGFLCPEETWQQFNTSVPAASPARRSEHDAGYSSRRRRRQSVH